MNDNSDFLYKPFCYSFSAANNEYRLMHIDSHGTVTFEEIKEDNMDSLPLYEEEALTPERARDLGPGDEVVFIDPRKPAYYDYYTELFNMKVHTIRDVNASGAIRIDGCEDGVYFQPRCFHLVLQEKGVDGNDFDAVFG